MSVLLSLVIVPRHPYCTSLVTSAVRCDCCIACATSTLATISSSVCCCVRYETSRGSQARSQTHNHTRHGQRDCDSIDVRLLTSLLLLLHVHLIDCLFVVCFCRFVALVVEAFARRKTRRRVRRRSKRHHHQSPTTFTARNCGNCLIIF